jgi:catechol 2,3-dioxygenase-like lactoylglutathione lyase family enzyme
MKHSGRRAVLAASMLGAALAIASLPGATLAKDGDIIRTGSCTGGADWKLKLSPEDGRIEVEFEVDQNQDGKTWNIRLKRDGNLVFKGQRTTHAPSGSFELRRVIGDSPGADHIKARAKQTSTGQVCVGTATFSA